MVNFMRSKKSFSQNFLTDKNIARKIVAAAEIKPDDLVLEIGPGKGILTETLLKAGARVIAVEADSDLIELLLRTLPLLAKEGARGRWTAGAGGSLIHGDILSVSVWQKLRRVIGNEPYSVVANIPYNITSPILETLFRANPRPTRLTLMVQREVVDRLLAVPPKTSVLSIACQLYAEGKKVMQVSRGLFNPPPKVDSTVVQLDLRKTLPSGEGREGCIDPEKILKIVKAGFSSRRKQLHGNLAKAGFCSSEKAKETLKTIGLDEKSRAENLTVENWVVIFEMLRK